MEIKKEIIVVSFGTSFKETREKTIGAIENQIRETFGSCYKVTRAFTSGLIIKKLRERDGIIVKSLDEALEESLKSGVSELIILPTHFMKGREFEKINTLVSEYKGGFDSVKLGEPLLYKDGSYDLKPVLLALTDTLEGEASTDTLRVLMGHGTDANSNEVYSSMNRVLREMGKDNYFIGTVEAAPTLSDCIEYAEKNGFKKVLLAPLMVVAGDHAINDMSGEDEDSWKCSFERAGFTVDCYLHGIGEMPEIQNIYVEKIKNLISA